MATGEAAPGLALGRSPLFEGLDPEELEDVVALMRPKSFAAGDLICREGEPGTGLFVIVDGLADVLYPGAHPGEQQTVARLRAGDVVGEMSLITGEIRSATVVASIPTTALELGQEAFGGLVARHPTIMANLTRILSGRLARMRHTWRERGEAVALVVGRSAEPILADVVAAAEAASPRPVAVLDARESVEQTLAGLDDALLAHGTVLVVAASDQEGLPQLLEHTERGLAIVGTAEAERLGSLGGQLATTGRRLELALVEDGRADVRPDAHAPVIRVVRRGDHSGVAAEDVSWLGRHLSRTKLGLALGAGGARGYAHVGALYVLEEAGYTVDYVAGSSIGAIVGAWLGLGMDAAEIESAMRGAFTPERVAEMFKLSLSGVSSGLDVTARIFRETTDNRSFDDLVLPVVVMSVDLTSRRPAPITDGPLWQALLAATALAGMFPPHERGDQRLVDGLALVPVPTGSVLEAGADVTVSVNIISRETLPAWPGQAVPEPAPARAGSRMLDTLLEVMDLAQLDASVRHAALADVVITPRFGPSTWRDFHLGDLFLAAGRQAAAEQLPLLRSLARPQLDRVTR